MVTVVRTKGDTQMEKLGNRHLLVRPKITYRERVHFALVIKSQCVFIPPAGPMLLWGGGSGGGRSLLSHIVNLRNPKRRDICIWRFILTIKCFCLALSYYKHSKGYRYSSLRRKHLDQFRSVY